MRGVHVKRAHRVADQLGVVIGKMSTAMKRRHHDGHDRVLERRPLRRIVRERGSEQLFKDRVEREVDAAAVAPRSNPQPRSEARCEEAQRFQSR
jgi:hypothetical protein